MAGALGSNRRGEPARARRSHWVEPDWPLLRSPGPNSIEHWSSLTKGSRFRKRFGATRTFSWYRLRPRRVAKIGGAVVTERPADRSALQMAERFQWSRSQSSEESVELARKGEAERISRGGGVYKPNDYFGQPDRQSLPSFRNVPATSGWGLRSRPAQSLFGFRSPGTQCFLG